jgi:FkbH-like protein
LLQIAYAGFAVRKLKETEQKEKSGKKIKLLVMDLDNTVWDGIVIETADSEKTLNLLPGVRETLEELDRRGILLSVAGKGNETDSRRMLEKYGLWDLMLFPQINWEPKSINIRRIVENLNIGMDTVAFIDDSEFEISEVKTSLPEVRVYRASDFPRLIEFDEFKVPVTEESKRRRMLYKAEIRRQSEFTASRMSYDEFLASCRMEMTLLHLDTANRERVYELVQRTNQLNFSANHYSRSQLDEILRNREFIPVVVSCSDRFGDYGIVGFALLRCKNNTLEVVDMMFSCRVQGKKVEHSFL